MERCQAWELLNNPDYSGRLTMVQFHQLLLRAGYSEDVAQRAATKRGNERLDAGVTM